MSHTRPLTFFEKLLKVRTLRHAAFYFFKDTMAGQKIFLHHEDFPRVINVSFHEYTCMYTCRMCPFHDKEIQDTYSTLVEMPFETLQKIVDEVPNDPHYSIDISALGETLAFKKTAEYIKYIKQRLPKVNTIISTNALPMTEKVFLALVDSGLDTIQLSMYANTAEDHAYITGTETYDRVISNIKNASRIKKDRDLEKPYLQAFIMDFEELSGTLDDFVETWEKYVDAAFIRPVSNVGRQIEGMTPRWTYPVPDKRYPCLQPWYSTAIGASGDVNVCRALQWYKKGDAVVIGNINDTPLRELWQSPPFKEFRELHLRQTYANNDTCKKCDTWASYTNIWTKKPDGSFQYNRPKVSELFQPAKDYRGG